MAIGPSGHTDLQRWQASMQRLQNLMAAKQAAGRLNPMGAFRYNALTNPKAVASWFGGLNAEQQNAALHGGMSPFGQINPGTMIGAAEMGGLNSNSINQMINYNDANRGYAPASVWDFTSGGSKYGPAILGNQLGASWDALNKASPYDPAAYNPNTNYNILNGNNTGNRPNGGNMNPAGGTMNGGTMGGVPTGSGMNAYQGVPPSQNAVYMLQQGIGGSWNPHMPVYTGPAGATGDQFAGINANGTAVNSGSWQATAPQVQQALGGVNQAVNQLGSQTGTMAPATTAQPTGGAYHPNR